MLDVLSGPGAGLSRRVAMAAAFVLPLVACASATARPSRDSDALAGLIRRADAANAAFIRGDMRTWHDLASPIAENFTLMQPLGGVSHGFDGSDAHLAVLARTFTSGEATMELVQAYAVSDMAVLVFIERQTSVVADLPAQDWSLRVTQVYRRRGASWELVHRHADPLVSNIGMERTAALARES